MSLCQALQAKCASCVEHNDLICVLLCAGLCGQARPLPCQLLRGLPSCQGVDGIQQHSVPGCYLRLAVR